MMSAMTFAVFSIGTMLWWKTAWLLMSAAQRRYHRFLEWWVALET